MTKPLGHSGSGLVKWKGILSEIIFTLFNDMKSVCLGIESKQRYK